MVKNLVPSWQILIQLQPQKHAKQSHLGLRVCGDSWTLTCSSKTVH